MPEERISMMISSYGADDPQGGQDLERWWENYLAWKGWQESSALYPEISLSSPLGKYRLVAKYDLILVKEPNHFTIVDLKTSRKHPGSRWLEERMQSKVYPYLLVSAGCRFAHGEKFEPELVEMVYWFAEFPHQPQRFAYSHDYYIKDQEYISALTAERNELGASDFPLTSRIERCVYCVYRSFCNRGIHAGSLNEIEELQQTEISTEITLDFEQIGEIEY
jgi:CRISPR/Cas system-associated exonuclease Cas4 (RecB family)